MSEQGITEGKRTKPADGLMKERATVNTQLTDPNKTDKGHPKLLKTLYAPSREEAAKDETEIMKNKIENNTAPSVSSSLNNTTQITHDTHKENKVKMQEDIIPTKVNDPSNEAKENKRGGSTFTPSLSSRISTAISNFVNKTIRPCLLYTSDAADE